MAREQPDAWARCGEREWHIGHLHIKEEWASRQLKPVDQDGYAIKGVRVRRLSSLSAHDFWHTKHAYMDRRACDSFVFHKTAGFTSALSFNVDHFTGKALSHEVPRMGRVSDAAERAFTFVSRARNSGSYALHAVAAVASNGVWINQIVSLDLILGVLHTGRVAPALPLLALYCACTVTGSVGMHWIGKTYIEKGRRKVGA
jgi:hypothetical protein